MAFNSTEYASTMVEPPFLAESLHAFLMSSGTGQQGPSWRLISFFKRVYQLHILPPAAAEKLLLNLLCIYCYAWFGTSLIGVLYWRIKAYFSILPAVYGVVMKLMESQTAQPAAQSEAQSVGTGEPIPVAIPVPAPAQGSQ